jgi:hypothetical protein
MPNLLNFSNPMNEPIMPQMREVGSSRKLTLRQYDARSPADLDGVISAMKRMSGPLCCSMIQCSSTTPPRSASLL